MTAPGGSAPDEAPEYAAIRRRRRRTYLIAGLVIVVLSVVSVAIAASLNPSSISGKVDTAHLPDDGPAPRIDATGWINSKPITPGELRGKVVLYDFWTYSCINCVRTFPFIRTWYDRYRRDGLVVVGVHSPEFDFEKVPKNVAAATKRLDVTWPVALDPDMKTWSAFDNHYWPADYVADRRGHLRYNHFGEGDYENTENVLRTLLGVPKSAPRAKLGMKVEVASGASGVNPETYLGTARGAAGAVDGPHTYPDPGNLVPPDVGLAGRWTGAPEKITSDAAGAAIVAGVRAQSVNLVLASATGRPVDAVVTLDGKPVPANARGASIHDDGTGQTVVTVTAPDMYRLVLTGPVENHELTVTARAPGLEAYSFTFG